MKKQFTLSLVAVVLLLVLTGCPGGSPLAGSWVITQAGGITEYGLELNADGTADPFTVTGTLNGTFTWESDGTRVLFHQVTVSNDMIVWSALILSDTNLSGAWVTWNGTGYGDSNTFSAAKQ
jgi:hypothetical protein